jgi:hypothetical protein
MLNSSFPGYFSGSIGGFLYLFKNYPQKKFLNPRPLNPSLLFTFDFLLFTFTDCYPEKLSYGN